MSDFKEIDNEDYRVKTNIYKITIQKLEDRFLWIYAKFGETLPYSNEVFDAEQEQIVSNPRNKTQAELNKQIFSLYDFQSSTLFLRNENSKTFLEKYFKETLEKDFVIKAFFKNPQEFMESIAKIQKITFTSKRNVITSQVKLFDKIENIFGLGQPERFYIRMDYQGRKKTDEMIEFFQELKEKKDNLEIESLVVIGEDDNNVKSMFNIENYIQIAKIDASKNENGMYDENVIKNNLILKIKENENV